MNGSFVRLCSAGIAPQTFASQDEPASSSAPSTICNEAKHRNNAPAHNDNGLKHHDKGFAHNDNDLQDRDNGLLHCDKGFTSRDVISMSPCTKAMWHDADLMSPDPAGIAVIPAEFT